MPKRYESIPEWNEVVPNQNENIPDKYWNLGKPKLQKNHIVSGIKNLKIFFLVFQAKFWFHTEPNLKSWNFEKSLLDSYSLKKF